MRHPRIRPASGTALVLAGVVAAILAVQGRGAPAGGTSVVVNLGAAQQEIQGFGTSTRVWSDPHLGKSGNTSVPADVQTTVLRDLFTKVGLTRARPVLDPGVQKTPGGPFDFSGKLGDAHAAFVKQARPFGLRTVFPGPVYLEDWMKAGDPGAYVDWAMAMLQRWRQDGVDLALYAPLNEPKVSGNFPPQWMHDVVLQLGQRMRAAGFQTKLVIPDDENPVDAYARAEAVLSDPAARQYVAAVAFHIYHGGPRDWVKLHDLAAKYGLPLWMTEYYNKTYDSWVGALGWAVTIHQLLTIGNVNAVDYLFAFFGSWAGTASFISLNFDNGQYRSMQIDPLYWITGQFARYVRPGYVRVAATPPEGAVLTSAYRGPSRAIVVSINNTNSPQPLRVTVTGGKLKGVVRPVQSSSTEHWQSLPPLKPKSGTFATTLPPQSITTFVAVR